MTRIIPGCHGDIPSPHFNNCWAERIPGSAAKDLGNKEEEIPFPGTEIKGNTQSLHMMGALKSFEITC